MATTRERLRELLDTVPDDRLADAEAALRTLAIPDDDEPVTDDDRASLATTHEAHTRDELVPHDVAMREIGLRVAGSPGTAARSPTWAPSPLATDAWPSESETPPAPMPPAVEETCGSSRAVWTSTVSEWATGASCSSLRMAGALWQSPAS